MSLKDAKTHLTSTEMQKITIESVRAFGKEEHSLVVGEYDSLVREQQESMAALKSLQAQYLVEVAARERQLASHASLYRETTHDDSAPFAEMFTDTLARTDRLVHQQAQLFQRILEVSELRYGHAQAVASVVSSKLNAAFLRAREAEKEAREKLEAVEVERDDAVNRLRAMEASHSADLILRDIVLDAAEDPASAQDTNPTTHFRSASDPQDLARSLRASSTGPITHPFQYPPSDEAGDVLETLEQVTKLSTSSHRRNPSERSNLNSFNLSEVDSSELAEMLA